MSTKKLMARRTVSLFLVCIMAVIMSVPALAYSTSSRTEKTVYGVKYTYYSTIDESSGGYIDGGVVVAVDKTVGEGYIGAKKRLYTSDGTLAKTSDWDYNSGDVKTNIGFHFFLSPTSGY